MSYTAFDRFVAWYRFKAAIVRQPRVCDVGCGLNAGFMSFAGSRIGFHVDLDYQSCRANLGLHPPVVQCDLTHSIPLSSEKFGHKYAGGSGTYR